MYWVHSYYAEKLLVASVQKDIDEKGAQPWGPLQIHKEKDETIYTQAMVTYTKSP